MSTVNTLITTLIIIPRYVFDDNVLKKKKKNVLQINNIRSQSKNDLNKKSNVQRLLFNEYFVIQQTSYLKSRLTKQRENVTGSFGQHDDDFRVGNPSVCESRLQVSRPSPAKLIALHTHTHTHTTFSSAFCIVHTHTHLH